MCWGGVGSFDSAQHTQHAMGSARPIDASGQWLHTVPPPPTPPPQSPPQSAGACTVLHTARALYNYVALAPSLCPTAKQAAWHCARTLTPRLRSRVVPRLRPGQKWTRPYVTSEEVRRLDRVRPCKGWGKVDSGRRADLLAWRCWLAEAVKRVRWVFPTGADN